MSSVMIKCPATGRSVSTSIETAAVVFRGLPEVPGRMLCPACGQEHVWTMSGAWLAEEAVPAPALAPEKPAAA
jgi:hypothetical protein